MLLFSLAAKNQTMYDSNDVVNFNGGQMRRVLPSAIADYLL